MARAQSSGSILPQRLAPPRSHSAPKSLYLTILRTASGRNMTRNFRGDFPPLPNFLIAGATRSGTTFLHKSLERHPEIFVPDPKELWYFNVDCNYKHGLSAYRHYFSQWSGEHAIGEATPLYFNDGLLYHDRKSPYYTTHDSAIRRIANSLPDSKLILSLRNPRDRLVSQYQKNFNQRKNGMRRTLEAHLRATNKTQSPVDFVHMNRYDRHLTALFREFDPQQILIVIFEEWTKNPEQTVRQIFRFLNVDDQVPLTLPTGKNDASTYIGQGRRLLRTLKSAFSYTPEDEDKARIQLSNSISNWLDSELEQALQAVEKTLGRRIPDWRDRRN